MKHALLATLLSSSLLLSSNAIAQQQPIPPTLLQRIRQLLGLVQPVAAGGSRGNSKQLCLISPFVASQQEGAVTPTATPTIRVLQPLNEVRIEKDGLTLWRKVASSSQAIKGLIPGRWPLEPKTSCNWCSPSRCLRRWHSLQASSCRVDQTRALLKAIGRPSAGIMGHAYEAITKPSTCNPLTSPMAISSS